MIRACLLTEGSSDQVLMPMLQWLLEVHAPEASELTWGDLRGAPRTGSGLAAKVAVCLELYPCDLLLIHRDRDRSTIEEREREIRKACSTSPVVPVVPVQMQEA